VGAADFCPAEGRRGRVVRVAEGAVALLLPLSRDGRAAELGDEPAPHLTDARAGRDDPLRRRRGLELEDLQVLLLGRLDGRTLLLDPGLDLRRDVLLDLFAIARSLVLGEGDLIDGR